MTKRNKISNIRGVGHLTIDAITGVTNIVEELQNTIMTVGGVVHLPMPITKSINKLIFNNIRVISKFTGGTIDLMLKQLVIFFEKNNRSSSPATLAAISALNGVIGDYLKKSKNPLEIKMQLLFENTPLFDKDSFPKKILETDKIVLMIHGSSMNHLQWSKKNYNYANNLKEIGYQPIYLYYNTGLHISENGKLLSEIMEKFSKNLKKPTEIVIISHSMGGLISRSACYYSQKSKYSWINNLKKIIFIGVPHHGAILERSGNFVTNLMDINPYIAPFSRLGKLRSAGITDLRYGSILESDRKGVNRFECIEDRRTPVPLPKDIKCYAIATIIGKTSNEMNNTIGDGLVTVNSALGFSKDSKYNLEIPENHKKILNNINHLGQLHNSDIYKLIKQFILN